MPKRGESMPKHEVPCIRCGVMVLRAVYLNKASCLPCRNKAKDRNYGAQLVRQRSHARRYRILCEYLGWPPTAEGFRDMLEEVKRSPMAFRSRIESRFVKVDMFNERKAACR